MGDLSNENHEWICQERKKSLRDSQNTHPLFLFFACKCHSAEHFNEMLWNDK
jgi:hypothetical protein